MISIPLAGSQAQLFDAVAGFQQLGQADRSAEAHVTLAAGAEVAAGYRYYVGVLQHFEHEFLVGQAGLLDVHEQIERAGRGALDL